MSSRGVGDYGLHLGLLTPQEFRMRALQPGPSMDGGETSNMCRQLLTQIYYRQIICEEFSKWPNEDINPFKGLMSPKYAQRHFISLVLVLKGPRALQRLVFSLLTSWHHNFFSQSSVYSDGCSHLRFPTFHSYGCRERNISIIFDSLPLRFHYFDIIF